MLESLTQRRNSTVDDNVLMDLAVIVSECFPEKPDWSVTVPAPATVADLLSKKKVSSSDSVRRGCRVLTHNPGNLPREIGRTVLISVQHKNPIVHGVLNGKVSLSANCREWDLVHYCTTAPGHIRGVVRRTILHDEHLGRPFQTCDAGTDTRGLVACRNDG